MTMMMEIHDGVCRRVLRNDAVKHQDRYIVPTREETKWVSSWDEFKAAGGMTCFNEDQTEIELLLPEGYKFSIQFNERRS
jgi:hypothetical protein